MKLLNLRLFVLALPLAATSFLASCVIDDYPSTGYNAPSASRYVTYTSLPSNYSGDAYFYNNRYYAGGRYEPGTYTYQGQRYNDRYFHNGQYIYGGDYRRSTSRVSSVLPSTSTSYVTYRTLPSNHLGDAYYYNNRYYAGGRYEPGTYSYNGRNFDNRYFHDGKYLYGGAYRQSSSVVTSQGTFQRATPTYRSIRR
jgi:hypothetical protein